MNKNQSLLFRFLLFLAGAGIIVLAFFLTKGDRELNRIDAFIWTSIALMYLIFFLPFFFSAINISNFTGKIPSLALVWVGIFLYIAASVVVIVALATLKDKFFNAAVIIQSILLFIFLVNIYLAYFASSRVGRVAAQEAVKQQYLTKIKPKAQTLALTVNRLPAEHENAQKILKQTLEEIKYIYPGDNGAGDELEILIMRSLNTVSELCAAISGGAHSAALAQEAENLRALVKERKMLRN